MGSDTITAEHIDQMIKRLRGDAPLYESSTVTRVGSDEYCVAVRHRTPSGGSAVGMMWIDRRMMQDLFAALGTALQAEYRPAKVDSDQMKMWR